MTAYPSVATIACYILACTACALVPMGKSPAVKQGRDLRLEPRWLPCWLGRAFLILRNQSAFHPWAGWGDLNCVSLGIRKPSPSSLRGSKPDRQKILRPWLQCISACRASCEFLRHTDTARYCKMIRSSTCVPHMQCPSCFAEAPPKASC